MRRSAVAFAAFAASLALSAHLGWSMEHLHTEWGIPVALVMCLLSGIAALGADDRHLFPAMGVLLCMPGLWASNVAHHLILALPFFVFARPVR